jgi:hypothetical protein
MWYYKDSVMKVGTVQPPLGIVQLEWFVDQTMSQY